MSVAIKELVNDSTGNTFRLIEQQSHRLCDAYGKYDEGEGRGATYEAVAACGATPSPATAGGIAAAAIWRGDFTFTRKLLPPAAVPGRVDSSRRAANSTPSPLHLHAPPLPPLGGQAMVTVPTSIEEVLAQFKDIHNPKGGLQRMSADVVHHL